MRTGKAQRIHLYSLLRFTFLSVFSVWAMLPVFAETSPVSQNPLQTINHAQGLRFSLTSSEIRITPETGDSAWSAGLTWRLDNRISVRFQSGEDGLTQTFQINRGEGPADSEGLVLHQIGMGVAAEGVRFDITSENDAVFITSGGREVLRYTLLSGLDADAQRIPVKMVPAQDGLRILALLDPRQTQFPVLLQCRLSSGAQKERNRPEETGPEDVLLAPTEDTCPGAQVIPAGPYPVLSTPVNNSGATDTDDPANTCQTNSHRGIWFSFTPETNDTFSVTTCQNLAPGTTRTDTVLGVFTSPGGCAGPFTQVSCNDDDNSCTGFPLQSRASFTASPGTTYFILAYSYGTTGGNFQIHIDTVPPPPANDLCPGAVVIPENGPWPFLSTPQDNRGATNSGDPDASCSPSEALGLWFSFSPEVSGSYDITTCQNLAPGSARQDTVLSIFSSLDGCNGPFAELAGGCNDINANCTGHPFQSVIQPILTAGKTYYILAFNSGFTTTGPVQLLVQPSAPAPLNDECAGAQVIPSSGPFPYLTSAVDLTQATTTGDPETWSCSSPVHHIVWYEFTPEASGLYTFTTCNNQAPDTTCLDTVLALFTSSTEGCGGVYSELPGSCNDNDPLCPGATGLSTVSTTLTAGKKYFLLIGTPGTSLPQPGQVQMHVTYLPSPANDTCDGPMPLSPGIPLEGSTMGAFNDYQLSGEEPTCFPLPSVPAPIGQNPSTAPGREVVFSFTPPETGLYSCRVFGYSLTQNLVLHVSDTCSPATPGIPVTLTTPPCLGASNRSPQSWQEEVMGMPMNAGQTYFVFVDDHTPDNPGSTFNVICQPAVRELEANDSPSTANLFRCGIEGSISPNTDVDFFLLPGPSTPSRLFAMADGGATSTTDFDLRVTSLTDTLEYDDADLGTPFGLNAPGINGVTLAGSPPFFLRLDYFSASAAAEPYRIFAVVEPPATAATGETEPNDQPGQASAHPGNYFRGTMASTTDTDWYSFAALAGETIFIGLDTDPNYDGTANNLALSLFESTGSRLLVSADGGSATTATLGRPLSPGQLSAKLPVAPGEALWWQASYSGTYLVKVSTTGTFNQEYLLAISKNCQIRTADFSVTQTDSPDPVATGNDVTYSLVVTNQGPGPDSATLQDILSQDVTFVSLSSPSGWWCTSPPVGVTGTVNCSGPLDSGNSATITIAGHVKWCLGNRTISNRATVILAGPDANPEDNSTIETTAVTDDGFCWDDDPCTNDICLDPEQGCGHTPLPPPPAVNHSLTVTGGPGETVIAWTDSPGPFNVYRGLFAGSLVYNHTCFEADIAGPSHDGGAPNPGESFYYLVSRLDECGESILGLNSAGETIPNSNPCP